jgi:hypothetical protein
MNLQTKSPSVADYIPAIDPSSATVEEMDDWIVSIGGEVVNREQFQATIRSVEWSDVPGENPGDPEFPFAAFVN